MFGARIASGVNEMSTQSIVWQSRAEIGNSGWADGQLCGDLGGEDIEEEAQHCHYYH